MDVLYIQAMTLVTTPTAGVCDGISNDDGRDDGAAAIPDDHDSNDAAVGISCHAYERLWASSRPISCSLDTVQS